MTSSVDIASAMLPAEDSDAMPSPMQVEYASIECWMCGRQAVSSESPITAESLAKRVGEVGALARVSPGLSGIGMWPVCWAGAAEGAMKQSAARNGTARRSFDEDVITFELSFGEPRSSTAGRNSS